MDIVMLSGKQGSGKSSLASELLRIKSRLGYTYAGTNKFADPLYELHDFIANKVASYENMVGTERMKAELPQILWEYLFNKMETFGLPRPMQANEALLTFLIGYVDGKIAAGKTQDTSKDGALLQYIGTEFGRTLYGKNVWIDILKLRLDKLKGDSWSKIDRLAIVDDCRFENEFDAFPETLRVRLRCPEEVRKLRADSWRDNVNHPSEIDLDKYDAEGRFDLYLETDKVGIADCATLIAAQLQKKSWKEKRKEF
jgi:uncharacterized protein YbjQ (UPF0145 family)